MGTEHCFRCGAEIPPLQGHYDVTLNVTFCKRCSDWWIDMINRHRREEQDFLQALEKGRK